MELRVLNYIKEHKLIEQGQAVVVGVSGGADSVCLLKILAALREHIGYDLFVLHIEHGIRGEEAIRDMKFVEDLCEKMKIPCKVIHYAVPKLARERKLSEEEMGRVLRYQAFEEQRQILLKEKKEDGKEKYSQVKIATAHHANDNAETILFHLARGSGLSGLTGMEIERGAIIRPLLFVKRKEIEEYLACLNQPYCVDSTNEEMIYARNKVRHKVVKELEDINEKAVDNINKTGFLLKKARDFIEKTVDNVYKELVMVRQDKYYIDNVKLAKEDEFIQLEIIKRALENCVGSGKNIGYVHVRQVLELSFKQSGKEISLPYQGKACKSYDNLVLWKEQEKKSESNYQDMATIHLGELERCQKVKFRGKEFTLWLEKKCENNKNCLKYGKKTYTKAFDYDKIENSLVFRTRNVGDYFIFNEKGQKKSLKSFFIDEKIPREKRDEVILLADGAHILWVVGYRTSFGVEVREDTRCVIKIQEMESV